jgi:preprotein translocase SecE subunit
MPRDKIILGCTECKSRNYFTTKNKRTHHDVLAEMRKVTWPDRAQLQDATIKIIIFVLFLGAIIGLMDVALQFILIRLPQLLLGR